MGLFDFLKKRKSDQSFSEVQRDITTPLKPIYEESSSSDADEKVTAGEPLTEISIKQESPLPLMDLIKTATPSKQGLYPHEILMLEYSPHFKISNNSFQSFWYWQYSVADPQSILDSLLKRGFTKVGNLKSTLEKLKLPEIKEELKQINQKVTGKKSVLIERLIEFGNLTTLSQKYPERYYVLTSKGEQELEENQYVSYLHRNNYMTIWEMNHKIAQTHYPYQDILWEYFNKQSSIHYQNFDFGLYRNTRLYMYQFLMKENKFEAAFHMLCEVLSCDLSGLSNSDKPLFEWRKSDLKLYLECYESRLNWFFPYKEDSLIIPPRISSWFVKMQTILNLDDKNYKKAIVKELQEVHLPQKIFTDKECADIVIADIHNDTDVLVAIYAKAEQREKARLEEIKLSLK